MRSVSAWERLAMSGGHSGSSINESGAGHSSGRDNQRQELYAGNGELSGGLCCGSGRGDRRRILWKDESRSRFRGILKKFRSDKKKKVEWEGLILLRHWNNFELRFSAREIPISPDHGLWRDGVPCLGMPSGGRCLQKGSSGSCQRKWRGPSGDRMSWVL